MNETVPGTGWFELGKAKVFANRALVSLAVLISGALLTAVENWVKTMIHDAPIPVDVQAYFFGINTWIASMLRSIVFPTATKIKE